MKSDMGCYIYDISITMWASIKIKELYGWNATDLHHDLSKFQDTTRITPPGSTLEEIKI